MEKEEFFIAGVNDVEDEIYLINSENKIYEVPNACMIENKHRRII